MIEFVWWQFALLFMAAGSAGAMLTDAIRHKKTILAEKRWREQYIKLDQKAFVAINKEHLAKTKLRRLENRIDEEVEIRLEQKVREWFPDDDDAKAEFLKAERMAAKREAINAGRLHPPRADGGEPARVSRITFRGGPVKPTDPK